VGLCQCVNVFLDEVTGCPFFVSGNDKCSQQAFVCFAQSVATRFCFAHVISFLFFSDVTRCCFSAANLPFLIFIRVIQITKMKFHIIDRENKAA
ncbi:hypothetical protein AFL20_19860, partial (plasmid) [Yersinia pestis subsp. microtus bv. Ulegeica]